MATATVFKPLVLRSLKECGGNFFALPADLSKEELIRITRKVKAGELSPYGCNELDELSGLTSPRFRGDAAECCDKWLAEKLAVFFAAWEKKHPGDVTLTLIANVVSEIRFWVRECVTEGFVFREYAEDYFPPSLPENLHYEAIRYNPVYWAIFDVLYEVSFNPARPIMDLVEAFEKPLFDSRFVYAVSQDLRGMKRNAA